MPWRNQILGGIVLKVSRFILAVSLAAPAVCVAQSSLVIYADSLTSGWQDWSYYATRNFANTSPVHSGSHSISVTVTNAWGAIQLGHVDMTNTPYAFISFWLNGGSSGGQQLQMYGILDVGGTNTAQSGRYYLNTPLSEALGVRLQDLNLGPPRQVRLRCKGQRERICPLWVQTTLDLKRLISSETAASAPLFLNQRGQPLTRHGVLRLLRRYSTRVGRSQPFPRRPLHPHLFRHSCAVALLRAGVDLTVIRDYLGHASIATINRYVSTNLKMKREALMAFWERAGISKPASNPWKPSTKLLDLLRSL
jgi:hypothetical protein